MDYFAAGEGYGQAIALNAHGIFFCSSIDENYIEAGRLLSAYSLGPEVFEHTKKAGLCGREDESGIDINTHTTVAVVLKKKKTKETLVVDNILSPKEYFAFSSTLEDNALIRYYKRSGISDVEVIIDKICAKEHLFDDDLYEYFKGTGNKKILDMIEYHRKIAKK